MPNVQAASIPNCCKIFILTLCANPVYTNYQDFIIQILGIMSATMTTYVWKTQDGLTLEQVQVGPADLIATASAASTAWGWVGGLDGIKTVLNSFPRLRDRATTSILRRLQVDLNLVLQDSVCHLITESGVISLHNEDKANAFGGHPVTQLIGLTICALAHNLGSERAVKIFMDHLAESLLAEFQDGIAESLRTQLTDNSQAIVNEGSTRSLRTRFDTAIKSLRLPLNPDVLPGANTGSFDNGDVAYVIGLLRWLTSRTGNTESYFTRSAVTSHVAACLKEVGFMIGSISVWDGEGEPHNNRRGIVLVTGGEHESDQHMLQEDPLDLLAHQPVTHYYHHDTSGSMIFNLFGTQARFPAHAYDSYFLKVHKAITANLSFTWEYAYGKGRNSIEARPQWRPTPDTATATALSLASIFFPLSAENFAQCYEDIAQPHVLEIVRKHDDQDSHNVAHPPQEVVEFLTITLSILLSVAEVLGGPGYKVLHHAINIEGHYSTIEDLSRFLNKGLRSGIAHWQAVIFIAVFHARADPMVLKQQYDAERDMVGYRDSDFAVLPALLFNLGPERAAFGLKCVDVFFCVPVQDDHTVRCGESDPWLPEGNNVDFEESDTTFHVELDGSDVGPPVPSRADADIFLTWERLPTSKQAILCLAARYRGYLIGTVSVPSILKTLARSFAVGQCLSTRHAVSASARTLLASHWVRNRLWKPIDQWRYSNYIAVEGHRRWAVFLAGQISEHKGGGCVVLEDGCFDCTIEYMRKQNTYQQWKSDAGAIVVGFGSNRSSDGPLQLTH